MYSLGVGGGGAIITSQYDAFAPQPENLTKDIQERADRVNNVVNYTISGREDIASVNQAILNEEARVGMTSMGYSGDAYEISLKYMTFLSEALDVVSTLKGNPTNPANQANLTKQIDEMNAAKQNLY